MAKGKLLIVDDNKSLLRSLEIVLMNQFDTIVCISDPNQIPMQLRKNDFQTVLLDMNFVAGINSGNEGIFWLNQIKEINADISVVLITAYGDVELAVKALKQGANDFILKPWDNSKLIATLRSATELAFSKSKVKQLEEKNTALKAQVQQPSRCILGNSPAILALLELIEKVAVTDVNVLITGENGTGKELVAQEIHRLSKRKEEIIIGVDMGAVSETLFESELFGHVKGAFTDAHKDRIGKFELANHGSLFLDEIGNLSYTLQAKLLAALQNRQITRVGGNNTIPVNIRLISATNKNLFEMVSEGTFREDLLYRINTIQIEVPPLRDRGEDIILLANHFLERFCLKYEKEILVLTDSAKQKLMDYTWHGNIRELQHTIEKAVILSNSLELTVHDFNFQKQPQSHFPIENMRISEMEEIMIGKALKKYPNNISASAEHLGISRQTLYNKMKKLNL